MLGVIDDLDDAAAMADAVIFLGFLDAQQHAVAEAGGFAGARLARRQDADFRRRAMRFLVPFVGRGDQVAVGVARRSTSASTVEGRVPGMVQLLAALLDRAFVGELAQQALELGAHGVLQAEGARDLAGADFAGVLADEGEEFCLGGEGRVLFGVFVQNR